MAEEKLILLKTFLDTSRTSKILWCLVSGMVMTLALPPFNLWPFMLVGLTAFYICFASIQTSLQAGFYGWLFGFGYFAAGLWWIANALLVEGNPYSWVWPFAIAGFPALLAFFPALVCGVHKRFFRAHTLSGYLSFIVLLSVSEWLRGHIFTGFPWNLYGYGWDGWLAVSQLASIGGAYLLSLFTIILFILPGYLLIAKVSRQTKLWLGATGLILFAINLMFGYMRLQTSVPSYQDIAVRIVQPNIAQESKWDPQKTLQNLENLARLSQPEGKDQAKTTYIVWPETALSESHLQYPEIRQIIQSAFYSYQKDVYLLTGWLRSEVKDGEKLYFNGLAVLDRNLSVLALYDKSHLVPFGEYIPLQNILPLSPFVQMDGFTAGNGLTDINISNGPTFSPLICYEVIFPGAVKSSERKTDWLVNVTNDAWYGNSPGPYQHFAQARFRAIEEGIPMVRAANTGISGIINPLGKVIYNASLSQKNAKTLLLPKPLEQHTLYSRVGDTLYFVCIVLLLLLAGIMFLREQHE